MFLLDTNVISELRKARPHGGVYAWYGAQSRSSFYLPSVVLYELQAEVELPRRQDALKAKQIAEWIDRVEANAQILPFNASSARLKATLMDGVFEHLLEDAMIAAIAKTNGWTVATRNIRDFNRFKVAVVAHFVTCNKRRPTQ